MPVFTIEGPDGKKYKVEGPTAEGAIEFLKSQNIQSTPSSLPEAPKPAPYEAEAQALADRIEKDFGEYGAGELFKNAFTLGLRDKVSGVVGGVGSAIQGEGFGKGYSVAQRAEEILEERARQRSGGVGTAAEIAGSLSTGALARAPAAATWLGRAGQAARESAILGTVQGVGDAGSTVSEMLQGGATGGLASAALGGTFSTALDAGAGLYRGARTVQQGLGRLMEDEQGRAVRKVNEALQNDAMTAQQAAARMRRSQADPNAPNLTLMDVADQNTLGLAAAAAAQPGPGRQVLNRYLDQRAAGAPQRTLGAAAQALGDPNTFRQTGEQLATNRSQHGAALYGAAFQNAAPVDVTPILARLDREIPTAKGGIQSNLRRVRSFLVRGDTPEQDLQSLHQAKMAIDEMLTAPAGEGPSIGRVSRARLAQVRAELLQQMDAASPGYAAARRVYADDSALMNALETGRRFLREDIDDLEAMLPTMGPAERQMFQQGAVREVREIIANAPDGADVVKRVFGSPKKRAALRAVFPDQRQYRQFQATMLREASARNTRDIVHVRRGSRTEVLRGDKEAASGLSEVAGAIGEAAASGGLSLSRGANMTTQALAKLIRDKSSVSPEVAREVAQIMIQESPQDVVRILSMGPQAARAILPTKQELRRRLAVGGSVALPNVLAN